MRLRARQRGQLGADAPKMGSIIQHRQLVLAQRLHAAAVRRRLAVLLSVGWVEGGSVSSWAGQPSCLLSPAFAVLAVLQPTYTHRHGGAAAQVGRGEAREVQEVGLHVRRKVRGTRLLAQDDGPLGDQAPLLQDLRLGGRGEERGGHTARRESAWESLSGACIQSLIQQPPFSSLSAPSQRRNELRPPAPLCSSMQQQHASFDAASWYTQKTQP